jgi:hypothetical protein
MLGVAVEWLLRLPDDRGMASILGISNQQRFVLLPGNLSYYCFIIVSIPVVTFSKT